MYCMVKVHEAKRTLLGWCLSCGFGFSGSLKYCQFLTWRSCKSSMKGWNKNRKWIIFLLIIYSSSCSGANKIELTDITWICAVKDHQVCVRLGPSIKSSVQCPRLWPTVIDDAGKDPASDKSSQRQTFRKCEQLKPKMEIRNGIAVLCYGFLDFSIRFVLAWLRSEQSYFNLNFL